MVVLGNAPPSKLGRDGIAACAACRSLIKITILATKQLVPTDEEGVYSLAPVWGAWFCCDCNPPEFYVGCYIEKPFGSIDVDVSQPMIGDVRIKRGKWVIVNLREFTPQPGIAVQLPFILEKLQDPLYRIKRLKAEQESLRRKEKEERIQAILDSWRPEHTTVKLVIQTEEGDDVREVIL